MDQAPTVGSSWHRHYDRLHLHTDKSHSALPSLAFPAATPRYPSREHMIAYLESYARHFELTPRLDEKVQSLARRDGEWLATTQRGSQTPKRCAAAAHRASSSAWLGSRDHASSDGGVKE